MRALLALVALLGAALSLTVAPASGIDRPQTLSLLEIDESDASTNLGFDFERLPKPGDRFAFKSGIYRWSGTRRGSRIGHDEGICTFVRVAGDEQNLSIDGHCAASIWLPSGAVLVEGFVRFAAGPVTADIAVVGGTGAYANVRGFMHIRDLGNGDIGHTSLTLHLLP
jgi:allene oxide cyclase-like protein